MTDLQTTADAPVAGAVGQPGRPIASLSAGRFALVTRVEAEQPTDADRLKSMGVCAGRRIRLVKAGDPLILSVLGARLGLSARLARGVFVVPCPYCPTAASPGDEP